MMKTIFVFFVCLSIAKAQTMMPKFRSVTCDKNNFALQFLKSETTIIEILSTLAEVSKGGYCRNFYKARGTCCNQESMEAEIHEVVDYHKMFYEVMVSNYFDAVMKIYGPWIWKVGAKKLYMSHSNSKQMQYLIAFAQLVKESDFKKILSHKKNNIEKCANIHANLSVNSICALCSPEVKKFTKEIKNKMYITISKTAKKEIVKHCYRIGIQFQLIADLLGAISSYKPAKQASISEKAKNSRNIRSRQNKRRGTKSVEASKAIKAPKKAAKTQKKAKAPKSKKSARMLQEIVIPDTIMKKRIQKQLELIKMTDSEILKLSKVDSSDAGYPRMITKDLTTYLKKRTEKAQETFVNELGKIRLLQNTPSSGVTLNKSFVVTASGFTALEAKNIYGIDPHEFKVKSGLGEELLAVKVV